MNLLLIHMFIDNIMIFKMTSKKRETISLYKKYQIVEKLEANQRRSDVQKEFQINSRQAIHEIWKNRHKIKSRYCQH